VGFGGPAVERKRADSATAAAARLGLAISCWNCPTFWTGVNAFAEVPVLWVAEPGTSTASISAAAVIWGI
jgi:hypothetical protein